MYSFEVEKKDKFEIKTGFYAVAIKEIHNPESSQYGEQLPLEVGLLDVAISIKKWYKTEFKWKIENLVKAFKMDATVTMKKVNDKEVETYTLDFTKQLGKSALALVYMNAKGYADIFEFIPEDASDETKNQVMAQFIAYRDNGFKFPKKKSAEPKTEKVNSPW